MYGMRLLNLLYFNYLMFYSFYLNCSLSFLSCYPVTESLPSGLNEVFYLVLSYNENNMHYNILNHKGDTHTIQEYCTTVAAAQYHHS